jgi:quinol monooxygenase YgiN
MKLRALGTAVAVVLLAALCFAQAGQQYLDIYIAQVKPEKRADFDAIAKKMVTANRQNKGDNWIAMETTYGPVNRVTFVSTRNSYAETETASDMFYAASVKAYGKAATDKLFQDFNQCLVDGRSELRVRRWDLSSNAPTDPAAYAKMVGETRWVRTVTIRVRNGHADAFEALLKDVKEAREKTSPSVTTFVSQAVAGQEGTRYYVTTLENTMGGFDSIPSMQSLLGDEGYAKFLKTNAEVVERADTAINHFLPELSNPPQEVISAAPDYWTPKPVVAAKAKPKTQAMVNAADKAKTDDKNK